MCFGYLLIVKLPLLFNSANREKGVNFVDSLMKMSKHLYDKTIINATTFTLKLWQSRAKVTVGAGKCL